jgi:sulfatase modifying factor 1
MIRIPAGWCWIGSEGRYAWESPRHRVFIDEFEMAPAAVRRREYARFLSEVPREEPRDWNLPALADPDQPVVGVNWFDATAYCEWLSQSTGESYRLPSEAEWEKACRGGNDDLEYAWGNEPPESLERYQGEWRGPRRVTEGFANGYGLFHMGDNVHEWCLDWYGADYYAISPERNPTGPESGTRRASRGGSWRHLVKGTRAAHRSSLPPAFRYADYGFRVVRDQDSCDRASSRRFAASKSTLS